MLDKVSRIAERAASGVSRREFLGKLGYGAMQLAAAFGGMLVLLQVAQGRPPVRICSDRSSFSCVSAPVGAQCYDSDGFGTCRKIRGTNDCFCYKSR